MINENATILNVNQKEEVLNQLFKILSQDLNITIPEVVGYDKKRKLFNAITTQIMPTKLSASYFEIERQLLQSEVLERGVVDVTKFNYKSNMCIWQGSIVNLNADAIVNAANNQMLGCFVVEHGCIDNAIGQAAGLSLRQELAKIMSKQKGAEPTGKAKLTTSGVLPAKHILHTVGPIIYDTISEKEEQELVSCYESCLNLAKQNNLNSVAFCCISTGEYRFDKKLACSLAVKTVKKWLAENNYCLNVVFNVFSNDDREIYNNELR